MEQADNLHKDGYGSSQGGSASFAAIEAALVDAAGLWLRSPRGGFSPSGRGDFATDAPWHLLTRLERAGSAIEAWGVQQADDADKDGDAVRLPLSRAEVARRDRRSELLALAPERDRRLVAIVVGMKARRAGERVGERFSFVRVRRALGEDATTNGLRMRYGRAITAICQAHSGAL